MDSAAGSSVHGLCSRLLCPWDFPGKNTGVGVSFPAPEDLPDPGIKPTFLASPALADGFFTTGANWEAHLISNWVINDN